MKKPSKQPKKPSTNITQINTQVRQISKQMNKQPTPKANMQTKRKINIEMKEMNKQTIITTKTGTKQKAK